uniref:BPTI/Kunitz inhibitor domain-containing protein n=1 Tax=Amblyomma triste TaxID=251400 RepID=A0A023GBW3_AMBTT
MKALTSFLPALFCLIFALCSGSTRPELCDYELDEGECGDGEKPTITRWYFNPDEARCGPFLTCGTSGNDNNFPNCTSCMELCSNHPDPEGICRDAIGSA